MSELTERIEELRTAVIRYGLEARVGPDGKVRLLLPDGREMDTQHPEEEQKPSGRGEI